ncbi:hypothetical protein BGW39_011695, partial [Mortierella sp. 14UC]
VGWGTRAGIDQTPAEVAAEKEKQRLDAEQLQNDQEKAVYESHDEATRAAIAAATAAATATHYEQQQQQMQQQLMEHPIILPARPDSPGSNELIRHFSRQQEQQRQTAAARATRLAHVDDYQHSRDNDIDEEDEDVYEYNQDDGLAQYFAQADAALNNLNNNPQEQQYPSAIYGGAGGASTIDLYGRGGAPASPPAGGSALHRSNTGRSNAGRGGYY